jgi:hypothetical protein
MKRVNKYKSQKVNYDYHSFASKFEASVYNWLKLREKNGEICDIKCQETIYLTLAQIIYKPDFSFITNDSKQKIWAEAKGFETAEWRIKRKLWIYYGPGPLEIYKGKHDNFRLSETLFVINRSRNAV